MQKARNVIKQSLHCNSHTVHLLLITSCCGITAPLPKQYVMSHFEDMNIENTDYSRRANRKCSFFSLRIYSGKLNVCWLDNKI